MAAPVFTQEAADALQRLLITVFNPADGEPNFAPAQLVQETVSLRNDVQLLQAEVQPGQGMITIHDSRLFVQNFSAKVGQLEQDISDLKTQSAKLASLESTLEPTLQLMNDQIQASLQELNKGASDSKEQAEQQIQAIIKEATDRFKEIGEYQQKLTSESGSKFRDMEQQLAQFKDMAQKLNAMRDADISAVRQKLAESGVSDRFGAKTRQISEFKAIANLEHFENDSDRIVTKLGPESSRMPSTKHVV